MEAALKAQLPQADLVLRAHRPPLVRDLSSDVVCTSLSGPGCLAGVAAAGASAWSWQRNASGPARMADHAVPWLQPSVGGDDRGFSWGFLATASTFESRLATGDSLVFFFKQDCPECVLAAAAVSAAARGPLRDVKLRYLAVGCDEGSPTAAVCAANVVGSAPQLRLYYGSRVSVRMDPVAVRRALLEADDEDDEDEDEEEEEAGDVASLWSARTVAAFYRTSTTPATRAKLQTANALLTSFLGGSSSSTLSRRLAADLGDEEEEEEAEEGEGDGSSSRTRIVLQALGQLIAGRREGGDAAAATTFRTQVEALLSAHDLGVETAGGEEAETAVPSQQRSLPSRVRRHLQLVNARALPIDVLWIDFSGVERKFSRVEPGRTVKLATFTQHLWRVAEAHTGKHLAFVVVRERSDSGESDTYRIVIT